MSTLSLASVPVDGDELLARFILSESEIRKSDSTARPAAFTPYKWVELSVTRHRNLSDAEIWEEGREVAKKRGKTLVGRADVKASVVRHQALDAVPDEPPRNHANIIGWPSDKSSQLLKAAELAIGSKFIRA